MFVTDGWAGAKEVKSFPVADARLQLDTQQMGQSEDGGALALGVGVDRVGADRQTACTAASLYEWNIRRHGIPPRTERIAEVSGQKTVLNANTNFDAAEK